jgi:hypothetical protein
MKKVALVLAVLMFAVPAWAGITVSAVQPDPDVNEVLITYEVDGGDANLPRAFALDITVTGINTVISNPYDTHSEFYVYPGSIVISGGVVTNNGTPVASKTSTSMTIEMGSLYATNDPCHTSPPANSGTLFAFTIDSNDCDVDVSIAGNAPRGNVVMEDPDITYNNPSYVTYVGCSANVPTCDKGCTCWGDVTDIYQNPPGDGVVDTGDLNYLIYQLYLNGFAPIDPVVRTDLACVDLCDIYQIPPGDGVVDTGDLNYLIYQLYLNGWTMGCM